MANMEAFADTYLLIHASPLEGVLDLLRNDTARTFFLRE